MSIASKTNAISSLLIRKRHKGSSEAQSTDGQEEGEVVSKRRSRRTRESKQSSEPKQEPAEQEEGQLSSP